MYLILTSDQKARALIHEQNILYKASDHRAKWNWNDASAVSFGWMSPLIYFSYMIDEVADQEIQANSWVRLDSRFQTWSSKQDLRHVFQHLSKNAFGNYIRVGAILESSV